MHNKLDEIKQFVDKHHPDFFFICEAELKVEEIDRMSISGYNLEIADSIQYGKSRVIVYAKHPYSRKLKLEGKKENIIVLETKHERIIGLYRGFKNFHGAEVNPLTSLFDVLENACKTPKPLVVLGDFNIDPTRDSLTPQGKLLEKLTINNGLTQLINTPTRRRIVNRPIGTFLEESTLDLILSNIKGKIIHESTTSDHDLIGIKYKNTPQIVETKKVTIRDWVCLTPRNVARVISSWQQPENLQELETLLSYVLEKLAPYRVIRTRLTENIINPKIEKIKKRRDRMYRLYKLSNDEHWLFIVKKENKKLKKMITSETKRIVQKKAESGNTKGFWQMVGQLQGKTCKDPKFKINGQPVTDPDILANKFADYFEKKILNLTSQMTAISARPAVAEKITPFTDKELDDSLKFFKTKMSAGPDGIPMRLVKFYAQKRPHVITSIFNTIIQDGFPEKWRLARVTPVPKKGDLSSIENYRPVSNLSSISKLYERCILHRLMLLPNFSDMLGEHQHGFRQNHSTTTCLMDLKDEICEGMDAKQKVLAYSLDLSAAFDMLRPDTFMDQMTGKIPNGLLGIIDEFLSNRKFYVEMSGKKSEVKTLDRGCPQGSVLGPVLFNLYTGVIREKIPQTAHLTSYADDSYVVLKDSTEESLISQTEECIEKHIQSLEEIGMKVNHTKTEIICFGKDQTPVLINVNGAAVESKSVIKALGIYIDQGLTWTPQVNNLKKRIVSVLGGVRMIRNKLTKQQATKVVTAQIFSILYYACVVWLTPSLCKKNLKTVERLHFKSLRLIIRDYRQRISRLEVTTQTKRLPPDKWLKYAMASLFMRAYNTREPTKLLRDMSRNTYLRERRRGFVFGYDASKTKTGKQSSRNWIGYALQAVSEPWSDRTLSKDAIRVLLKRNLKT